MGGLREMPTSRGRSVALGSTLSRTNIPAAKGKGGSNAGSTGPEAPFDADPFLEAAASAVSSATATAAFRESWLRRASAWASALEWRQMDEASEVPCPRTRAKTANRVNRDFTAA